VSRK